jgi:hypothetical protein
MRAARLLGMLACVWFLQTGVASAHYDWLDRLSGPGPFHGIDIQYRFLCVADSPPIPAIVGTLGIPAESRRAVTLGLFDQGAGVIPFNAPRRRPDAGALRANATLNEVRDYRAQYVEASCERDTNVRGYLALKWGPYKSSENLLFPRNEDAEIYQVRFVQTALKGGWRLWRAVDAVGSLGINRFTGDAFDSFWRPSVMAGFALYPVATVVDSQLARAFMVEVGAQSFLSGFEASDFCQPDRLPELGCRGLKRDFAVGVEVNPHIGVTVDLVFFKWLLGGNID